MPNHPRPHNGIPLPPIESLTDFFDKLFGQDYVLMRESLDLLPESRFDPAVDTELSKIIAAAADEEREN